MVSEELPKGYSAVPKPTSGMVFPLEPCGSSGILLPIFPAAALFSHMDSLPSVTHAYIPCKVLHSNAAMVLILSYYLIMPKPFTINR
jgi:hypothetical protein